MPTLFNCKQLLDNLKFSYNVTNTLLKRPYLVEIKTFTANSKGKGCKVPGKRDNSVDSGTRLTGKKRSAEPPEEPTTCCMSGCSNCVWVDYAEALCNYYKDGGEQAIKEINEKISDPNMRSFLLHELRMLTKK